MNELLLTTLTVNDYTCAYKFFALDKLWERLVMMYNYKHISILYVGI